MFKIYLLHRVLFCFIYFLYFSCFNFHFCTYFCFALNFNSYVKVCLPYCVLIPFFPLFSLLLSWFCFLTSYYYGYHSSICWSLSVFLLFSRCITSILWAILHCYVSDLQLATLCCTIYKFVYVWGVVWALQEGSLYCGTLCAARG